MPIKLPTKKEWSKHVDQQVSKFASENKTGDNPIRKEAIKLITDLSYREFKIQSYLTGLNDTLVIVPPSKEDIEWAKKICEERK